MFIAADHFMIHFGFPTLQAAIRFKGKKKLFGSLNSLDMAAKKYSYIVQKSNLEDKEHML